MVAVVSSGYRGPSLKMLQEAGAQIGDVVELSLRERGGAEGTMPLRGTLVPRYAYDDDEHVVIKLRSGYNIGIRVDKISALRKVATGEKPAFNSRPSSSTAPGSREGSDVLPTVAILGTGGTIASRVDYRTGAVHPAISAEDLYSLIPELSEVARIKPEIVLSVYSENLEPEHWSQIAERVATNIAEGATGVVITTGTDVMAYTSAALSFALQGVPVPVLVVGSQRSSDRPSSDAYLNLIGAVSLAANAAFSGVYLVMHADPSDERLAVHSGTRVRKNHTSARTAFQSIGVDPVAYWSREGCRVVAPDLPPRSPLASSPSPAASSSAQARATPSSSSFTARSAFDPAVALVKFYPSMPAVALDALLLSSGLKGVVIEGTGLGHVSHNLVAVLEKFVAAGGLACMTSQCIWGRVDLNVYDTGRDLLEAGVEPLEDMLGETALAKMMWVLANAPSRDEARRLMKTNLAREMTERSLSPTTGEAPPA